MRLRAWMVLMTLVGCEPSAEERCDRARRDAAAAWAVAADRLEERADGLDATAGRLETGDSIFASEPTAIVVTAGEDRAIDPEGELGRHAATAIEAGNRAARLRDQADDARTIAGHARRAAETPTAEGLEVARRTAAAHPAFDSVTQTAADHTIAAARVCR